MTDLHATTDAQVWAKAWCETATIAVGEGRSLIDEGWMIGWFANAIEAGRTAGQQLEMTKQDNIDLHLALERANRVNDELRADLEKARELPGDLAVVRMAKEDGVAWGKDESR